MNSKKYFLCCLIIILSYAAARAQKTASIRGRLVDSADHKPVGGVNISIRKEKNTVSTVNSDANGVFLLKTLAPALYKLIFTRIGYAPREVQIRIEPEASDRDLGTIALLASSHSLKEVAVTGSKPLVKQDIDRITYDVQADPDSKVRSVLEVMRKVPLITIDGMDNIKLKGSGNFKILINGRASGMIARNPQDILKAMPASSIQKIEVITTPPAKYDSEGLAGLINIITNKKVDEGYNGRLGLRYIDPSQGLRGSGNTTIKTGKWGFMFDAGVANRNQPAVVSSSNRVSSGAQAGSLFQSGNNVSKGMNYYGSTQISFEADSLNLLTASFAFYNNRRRTTDLQQSRLYNTESSLQQGFDLLNTGRNGWDGMDGGLNYQLGFKRNKEQLFTFSYQFMRSGNLQNNDIFISERVNYDAANYRQNNRGFLLEQTIQADYVHPVSKNFNIEAGGKAVIRDNKSTYGFASFNTAAQDYVEDPQRTNNFLNTQNVYGVYNSYQYNLGNWGFKAGVRAELTSIDADFVSQEQELSKTFFNVIPSVSVARKLKDQSTLNFGYTQRIERPGIWELNPFVDSSNPNFISFGNPGLRPVLSNNFELGYSRYKKGSINVNLSYAFANRTVQRLSWYDEIQQVTFSSYQNIGQDRRLGANLHIRYPLAKSIDFNFGGNLYYVWFSGASDGRLYQNDGLQGHAYGNLNVNLGKGTRAGVEYDYNSPNLTLQGRSNQLHNSIFFVSKDIIKNKLMFAAAAINPFQKFREIRNITSGANFNQNSFTQNYYRQFGVDLTWRFGALKQGIRKNRRGIQNDDVKSGNSQN
ncbi:outer membrane beta-barrel family protein [Pedobacter sp. SYP-B3415]|uniref:outer membrane beta-barrel family protein n=1 Tax=Pedobacter sp. SYP-B3415 TaxID=2496641 RepID=UPI0013E9F831|nr:outer membrane beta-barrel family protein [Pedobacter sp. SYP-B3415]